MIEQTGGRLLAQKEIDEQHLLCVIYRITALTLWKIVKREGISQPGQATMEEFMGSAR